MPGGRYVRAGLYYSEQDAAALQRHVACVEDTQALRDALPGLGLVAFIGNGAILPRYLSPYPRPTLPLICFLCHHPVLC